MPRFKRMMRSVFILTLLLVSMPLLASYQLREFETAGTKLYMSFDNASLAGYWQGQTPLKDHQAQITSGALGNSCVAPKLNIQLTGNINPAQGCIAFFTRLGDDDQPLMQMLTADGQTMMLIGKVDSWLRPWIMLPNGKAIGREADTRDIEQGDWVHLALVWDQTKGIRFYLNGKLASHQWGRFHYADNRTPATLHLQSQHGIDELWIFDHPLDGTQIKSLLKGRLTPPSILAEKMPAPEPFVADAVNAMHQTYVPYQGTIPSWASSLRQLLIRTQQLTDTLEPVRFDPQQPTRLVKGHDLVYGSDKTLSSEQRQLTNLWLWYTRADASHAPDLPLMPKAQVGLAMQMLSAIGNGEHLAMHATMNLLATFGQEGDRRFLDAALSNALADETQLLQTLGLLQCRGLFAKRQLPAPRTLAVTWENMGNDVIARVNRVSTTSLHVTLFNFNKQPRVVTMRPWSLSAGQYQLVQGPDANDDDMVDQITLLKQWPDVTCGSIHSLTLPGGQTVIELVQLQAGKAPPAIPDPAVDAQWVTLDSQTDVLSVPVVNLGSTVAKHVTAELYADGLMLRAEHIDSLPATGDELGRYVIRYPHFSSLEASTIQVRVRCMEDEHSDRNNTLIYPLPVSH
jgi:hypothetical protein